jgi:hypothetical protein
MSEYLLNIAARSTKNDTNEMLSPTPLFNVADSEIVGDFAGENKIQDKPAQNHVGFLENKKNTPDTYRQNQFVLPTPSQKAKQVFGSNITETTEQKENSEPSYLSKHIERRDAQEDGGSVKNKATQNVSFKIDAHSQKSREENIEAKAAGYEQIIANKPIVKIPEKKGTKKPIVGKTALKPLKTKSNESPHYDETIHVEKHLIKNLDNEGEAQSMKKILPQHLQIERITPNTANQENLRHVQTNKMNEAAPKIIIGKIKVEILPPKLPAPQKIITKVVQPTSKDSYSKSNKLIFGLGQL